MAATCCPNDERRHNNSLALSDYGWYSHDDCLIIDLTSMPESTITVPWLFHNTWIDLEKWTPETEVQLEIQRLNGLKLLYDNTCSSTSSSVPKTFSVSVFIQVVDPEVSCPISPGATKFVTHTAQMDMLFTTAASAAGGMLYDAAAKRGTKMLEGVVEKGFSALEENTNAFLYGGKEGEEVQFNVSAEPPSEPLVVSHVVDEGAQNQMDVLPSVFGGMSYTAPRNVLGTGTMAIPKGNARHNSLSEFLQKPSCVLRSGIVAGGGTVISAAVYDGREPLATYSDIPSCSRLRFLSQYFRFWRGSITYTFMFISSPMVTFRLKIALDYQGGTLANISPGDTLQQLVTVRGTTVRQVTVPYLSTVPWQVIGDVNFNYRDISPNITVSEFSPASKSGDITPSCYVLVYESANPDFIMASQMEPMPYAQSAAVPLRTARHEAQMDIRKFRSQDITQFGSCNPVKYPTDGVSTFEAMAKRWSPRAGSTIHFPLWESDSYVSQPSMARFSTVDSLCSIFYYNRGQYKLKIGFDVDETVDPSAVGIMKMSSNHEVSQSPIAGVNAAIRFCDGATAISYGLTQVIECTVPFLCSTEWFPTLHYGTGFVGAVPYRYIPELWSEGQEEIALNFVAVAAGTDFCFSYNLPPPYFGNRWYDCTPYEPPAAKSTSNAPQNFGSHTASGSPLKKGRAHA